MNKKRSHLSPNVIAFDVIDLTASFSNDVSELAQNESKSATVYLNPQKGKTPFKTESIETLLHFKWIKGQLFGAVECIIEGEGNGIPKGAQWVRGFDLRLAIQNTCAFYNVKPGKALRFLSLLNREHTRYLKELAAA